MSDVLLAPPDERSVAIGSIRLHALDAVPVPGHSDTSATSSRLNQSVAIDPVLLERPENIGKVILSLSRNDAISAVPAT